MENLLEIKNLTKNFSSKNGSVCAVDGVSLSIARGECYGLVGESGSGKSTLGNLVCALESSDSGEIFFDGENISDFTARASFWQFFGKNALNNRKKVLEFRKKMQIIFLDPYATLNPNGSIIEESLKIHKIGENHEKRRKLVNEMRVLVALPPDCLEKYPSELSGGQRQRVAIASAMILRPEFLICDECVSSLDVLVQAQILKLLKDMQKSLKMTYLFISHNLNVVAYMADRIGVMYKGKIVEEKPTAEILKNPEHPYTKKLLKSADL